MFPFTLVPAYGLPVYASQCPLPDTTQDSVRGCWLGFAAVTISDDRLPCACKAQPPPLRTFRIGAPRAIDVDGGRIVVGERDHAITGSGILNGYQQPREWHVRVASQSSAARMLRKQVGIPDTVRITFSSSSSSGTKPLPPHVGHCRSSSVPFSMTPSPLQSGQVFTSASQWTPPQASMSLSPPSARPW